jgi:hypothetical protein
MATDAWAAREGADLEQLHDGLEEYGGGCDGDAVMTVDADEVFTPVQLPRCCRRHPSSAGSPTGR